ncbi:hypothetical protein ABZW11_21670 [Nonomuraea sp. NPDC004580]|uniref:hypothetical protein n=1 Tax=Nonomuraea sp. NPDC004580 TaxID=3154552 RepID=UPI0033B47E70
MLGLIRRRTIALPILALGLVLALAGFLIAPASYKAESSLILTPPPSGGTLSMDPASPIGVTNPLLQHNNGLRTVAGILIVALNGKDELRGLGVVEDGPTTIVIDDGRSNSDLLGVVTLGPFLHVAVESDAPDTARQVLERAHQRLRERLNAYQVALGAPRSTYIALNTVVVLPPEYDGTVKIQYGVGALLATLLLGLACAYAVQVRGLFRHRPAPAAGGRDEPGPHHAANGSSNGQVPADTASASAGAEPEAADLVHVTNEAAAENRREND